MHIFFLHGLESSGNGIKGTFLKTVSPSIICPDFTGDMQERMANLEALTEGLEDLILIGSSLGGLMATYFAIQYPARIKKLILFAPALNYLDFTPPLRKLEAPTLLVIGDQDTITPLDKVIPLARQTFANLSITEVHEDHLLHKIFPQLNWHDLLDLDTSKNR